MPKPSQASVTLNKKVYNIAKEAAEAEGKSTAGYIKDLILENVEVPANG